MAMHEVTALETAIELAKINIQSAQQWVPAKNVVEFIDEVYKSFVEEISSGR